MKTDANFRLGKSSKRVMSTIVDKNRRNIYKKLMVEATYAETNAKNKKFDTKQLNTQE